MIDAKHVHKLLECKYDFKHWIKDVISSFNFKDGIDYISYRYDNNGEQIIDNNSHVFRHDYYLFPKSILCIIYMKCDRSLFKDFIYDIFDCCNIKIEDRRGGGRGRSRRSDGTYMGYGGGIYDHYGMHEKMKEMEERENELEERERRLEERERRHEMEDREYRRMGYESYPTDYYGDDRYYGDGPQMRRGRGRGRGRSY